jgi:hypothetical protein
MQGGLRLWVVLLWRDNVILPDTLCIIYADDYGQLLQQVLICFLSRPSVGTHHFLNDKAFVFQFANGTGLLGWQNGLWSQ